MREIKLEPRQFISDFQIKANAIALLFDYRVVKGLICIVADSQQLETIGY